MSVQYTGVTVHWRISLVHQVDMMSTFGDTLHPDTTAVLTFIITDGRTLHQICFKLDQYSFTVFSVMLRLCWALGKC